MKRLRILVLIHENLLPPDTLEGHSDKEIVEWKTEFDVVRGLEELGHHVKPLGVGSDLGVVREAILEWKPDVAFCLLEEFHGVAVYDQHVVSYLELMRQPYTGCNPRGLMLARDKALSKKILTYHRVRVPRFAVFPRRRAVRRPRGLRYPIFVKSLVEEGSFGLAQASIVRSDDKLEERVRYLHETLETDVIAEEYIEGREFYVGLLGNRRVTALPILELVFRNLPEGSEPIATRKAKWDWAYQKRVGVEITRPEDFSEEIEKRATRVAKRVYRALSLSGCARVDFRITPEGEIFVLEANPNPDLAFGDELCAGAAAAGMTYPALLQRIVNLGLRYEAEWRATA